MENPFCQNYNRSKICQSYRKNFVKMGLEIPHFWENLTATLKF